MLLKLILKTHQCFSFFLRFTGHTREVVRLLEQCRLQHVDPTVLYIYTQSFTGFSENHSERTHSENIQLIEFNPVYFWILKALFSYIKGYCGVLVKQF